MSDDALRAELIEYSERVIAGAVVACKKHVWACKRFLRDMERENTDVFPYEFNPVMEWPNGENRTCEERPADRFLKWVGLFKHTKGILAGKKIEPHIIIKFIFGNVYGWIHRDTRYRRFNKFYWQVARKNAKSQSLACVGTYETMAFLSDEQAEVYCAATKKEQARIVTDEAEAMLTRCRELKGKYRVAYGKIWHHRTNSIMRPLTSEDKKTGDGLNPQCGIVDEYHAHDTSELYDILDSGMGARAQPLQAVITTAGFNLDAPCYRVEYDMCNKIIDPDSPVEIDNYFVMINELDHNDTGETIDIDGRKISPGDLIDDPADESCWPKSNPIICSYPQGVEYLRKKAKEAKEIPEKMRNFQTKHLNVWVNQRDCGYMAMGRWATCYSASVPDYTGMRVFGGVDLSSTIDLTSFGVVIPLPDDCYGVMSHSFIPEEKLEERRRVDKMPYDLWLRQEWLTATPGAEVDYHFVLAYILETYERYKWAREEMCYDRAMATWLKQELEDKGFTAIDIPQSYMALTSAVKDFRAKCYQGKIVHDGNPVLSWAIGNAVTRVGPSENLLLDKGKSSGRIDPLAALINAHTRAMAGVPEGQARVFFL